MAIFKDELGFLVSDEVHDGGDSARAHGLMAIFGGDFTCSYLLKHFVTKDGYGVRHPTMTPWSNKNNFTRDQLLLLFQGLAKMGDTKRCKQLFWTHAKRLFWCQNIERDYPGTRKSLFPQYYKKGQRFDDITIIKKDGWVFRPNFRDPLFANHIYLMSKSCGYNFFCFLLSPFAFPLLFLSLVFNSRKLNAEQNQLQGMVEGYGPFWVRLYVKFNPMWEAQTYFYWAKERNFVEMSNLIIDGIRKYLR